MNTHLLPRFIAAALLAAAFAAPAAGAEPIQPRVGSPDAIDRNREIVPPDLRGADARGVRTDAPEVLVVRITPPAPVPGPADSAIDWSDAMIGGGGVLGL